MKSLRKRIGWDISHLEFTIEDHYYFSRLKASIISSGGYVAEVRDFFELESFDTIVFNYPEIKFTGEESEYVYSLLKAGKRVLVTGYYNNEDNIRETVNSLSARFGVELNADGIRNYSSNFEGDSLLPVTDHLTLFNDSVLKIMIPCSASLNIVSGDNEPFLISKDRGIKDDKIMGAVSLVGDGEFIILGSCVFWDNGAIVKYNNLDFALNLLLGSR